MGNIRKMTINKIYILWACLLLTSTALAQEIPNIDSIVHKIDYEYGEEGWRVSKKTNSVLVLSYDKPLIFVFTNIRREVIADSIYYQLFIVFRKGKSDMKKYKNDFKQLVKKIQNYTTKDPFFGLDAIDNQRWAELLLYKIPPSIVFSDYSVVIFDNAPSMFNLAVKDRVEELRVSEKVSRVVRFLSEEGSFYSYKKYMSPFVISRLMGYFGLNYWGNIKKANYPNLFNE